MAEITHTYHHVHVKSASPPPLRPPFSLLALKSACASSRSRRLGLFLSPLQRGGFEFLAVSVDARRAGVQLDKELGEFVLGEHCLQETLEENVDQPTVHWLVLEHVKDA